MDWKSRRVEATLEQALVEDRATNDVTTAITIEPGLRASGTVVAQAGLRDFRAGLYSSFSGDLHPVGQEEYRPV